MSARHLGLIVALAFIVVQPLAMAQNQDDRAKARDAYKEAETHFALGEFDQAVAKYKESYELSKAPGLLFNIGQSYRVKGDHEQAIYFFETFLRLADNPPNQADVERLIAESRADLEEENKRAREAERAQAEQRKAEQARLAADAERKRLEAEASAREAREREARAQADLVRLHAGPRREEVRSFKIGGLVAAGAGLGIAAGGLVMGLQAKSDFDEANKATEWSPELTDTVDSAEGKKTLSIALTSIGAAAVVGGGVLFYLGKRGQVVEQAPVVVVPTQHGGHVSLTLTF